jgi:hypothetical protein
MLIFLGLKKVVDVNHLRSSMLIFSLLVPHPVLRYENIIFWLYWGSHNSFIQNLFLPFRCRNLGTRELESGSQRKKRFQPKRKSKRKSKLVSPFCSIVSMSRSETKKIVNNDLTVFCSFYTTVDSITVVITMITRKNYLECSLNTYTLKATNIFKLGNT